MGEVFDQLNISAQISTTSCTCFKMFKKDSFLSEYDAGSSIPKFSIYTHSSTVEKQSSNLHTIFCDCYHSQEMPDKFTNVKM